MENTNTKPERIVHPMPKDHGQYIYSTAPILNQIGEVRGTGFFLSDPSRAATFFVSCWHIFEDAGEWKDGAFRIALHGLDQPSRCPTNEISYCTLAYSQKIVFKEEDLVAFKLDIGTLGQVFYVWIPSFLIWDQADLNTIGCFEEVALIGYPTGLWDRHNNLPVPRKGIVASPAALNWKGDEKGIHATPCFPGDSGGPVFGVNVSLEGQGRQYTLLGVHDSAYFNNHPVCKNDSDEEGKVYIPVPVGTYIKAQVLLKCLRKEGYLK